ACHPTPTLFPYTTLFRSEHHERVGHRGLVAPLPVAGRTGLCARRPRTDAQGAHGVDPGDRTTARADRVDVDHGHRGPVADEPPRSEEHTSELQSRFDLVC